MSKKMKILYIDDEEVNTILFKINFSKHYEVLTGDSGFEGLDLLGKNPDTDVVISDMKMPKMNGIEFLKQAKEKYPQKKFYILTGFEITAEIQEAIDTGIIQKYFRKPFNIKEIEKTIKEA